MGVMCVQSGVNLAKLDTDNIKVTTTSNGDQFIHITELSITVGLMGPLSTVRKIKFNQHQAESTGVGLLFLLTPHVALPATAALSSHPGQRA